MTPSTPSSAARPLEEDGLPGRLEKSDRAAPLELVREEAGVSTRDLVDAVMAVGSEEAEERARFIEELKHPRGHWLQLTERYVSRGKWTPERVARDAWQNFSDANGYTLDGVHLDIREEDGRTVIEIHMDDEKGYDFTRLLAFGVGDKADYDRSAGGEGEGTRIMALHMLRDLGFTQVTFGANDWELDFSLVKVPAGRVPPDQKHLRGLYAHLKDKPKGVRNYARFVTTNSAMAKIFTEAKDFFYHTDNPDFKNPDIDNAKAGFKYHPSTFGAFYLNRQKMAYGAQDAWAAIPDFTFWSHSTPRTGDREVHTGRDRRMVTEDEVMNIYLPFLVDSMAMEDLQGALVILEPLYLVPEGGFAWNKRVGVKFLELMVAKLRVAGYQHSFNLGFLAVDVNEESQRMLCGMGYTPCYDFLCAIGMKKASVELREIQQVNAIERSEWTEAETRRIRLLVDFMTQVLNETERLTLVARLKSPLDSDDHRLTAKEIDLFRTTHPINGLYDQGNVFIKRDVIHGDVADVLGTYMHELCHKFGNDQSATFSYALTNLMKRWNRFLITHPEAMKRLNDDWEAIAIENDDDEVSYAWEFYELEDTLTVLPQHPVDLFRIDAQSLTGLVSFLRLAMARFDMGEIVQIQKDVLAHPNVQELERLMQLPDKPLEPHEREALEAERNGLERQINSWSLQLTERKTVLLRQNLSAAKRKFLERTNRKLEEELRRAYGRLRDIQSLLSGSREDQSILLFRRLSRGRLHERDVNLFDLMRAHYFTVAVFRILLEAYQDNRIGFDSLRTAVAGTLELGRAQIHTPGALDGYLVEEMQRVRDVLKSMRDKQSPEAKKYLTYAQLLHRQLQSQV